MLMKPLLTIVVAGGLALTACGSDGSPDTATSDTATTDTAMTDTATTDTATTPSMATVIVASDPTAGDHLADADGRSLYLFELDQGTTTACTGGCASTWPPLVADGSPTGGDGVDAAQLSVADGIEPNQVVYHGHLLYYFSGDQAPGDTNGVGIPSWYLVDPAGAPIGGS